MKAISHGNTYDIYDDSLKTYDKLPSQTYVVRFSKSRGFYLDKYLEMEITEPKIYGVHLEKVFKVLHSFERMNRSLGVILSGDKGIGKSLFAKILAIEAIKKDIPLIVVDQYIPGIASYIESIEQDIMVLFDEFDKTFGEVKAEDGKASPQSTMLSLFDGISGGKKLFVITCNQLNKLNDYLVNRPGRFHYHFRFEYPSADEIREYLTDKIDAQFHGEINDVIAFSSKISLNYDCLRAIAFELSNGLTFKEAIKDLNIINVERERYNLTLKYSNGLIARARDKYLDMFDNDSDEYEYAYLYDNNGNNIVDIYFNPSDASFDTRRGTYVIAPENLKLVYEDEYKDIPKNTEVECLLITRKREKSIHYTV